MTLTQPEIRQKFAETRAWLEARGIIPKKPPNEQHSRAPSRISDRSDDSTSYQLKNIPATPSEKR